MHTTMLVDEKTNNNIGVKTVAGVPDIFADVKAFHDKFGIGYDGPPRALDTEYEKFRDERFMSEAREYRLAADMHQRDGRLDAIVDIIYIGLGTCILHGWNFHEAWKRVHEANMKKELASSKNPGKFGNKNDIVKPPGWVPPTLLDLV